MRAVGLRLLLGICFLFLLTVRTTFAQAVLLGAPTVDPLWISQGVPTEVTVASVMGSSSLEVVPGSVVASLSGGTRTPVELGTLNDAGVMGDALADDGVFSGTFNLSHPVPRTLYIRVSALFKRPGVSSSASARRVTSSSTALRVSSLAVPASPRPFNLANLVSDDQAGVQIVCNEVLVQFEEGAQDSSIAAILGSVGGEIVGALPLANTYQVGIPTCDFDSANCRCGDTPQFLSR
jgi:hypothetical protein